MKNTISQFRYWLEIMALPAFIFLVIHLAGHGVMLLLEGDAHQGHEYVHDIDHASFSEIVFTPESLIGGVILIIFVWLWHRPGFKKWVPCRHDHCHVEKQMPHMLAMLAFCIHFFPEAGIRHALIDQAMAGEISSLVGGVAFGAHFLSDILVTVMLSAYWETRLKRFAVFGIIALVWFVAFFFGKIVSVDMASSAEGGMFFLSAFLLAMFIHKPHRPKKSCSGCCH